MPKRSSKSSLTSHAPHSHKKNVKSSSNGVVRIISGKWRGRKLPVKDLQGLRPTTDRVKETLFNWLAQDVYQSRCLDVFSGSGSLGFEALSRQAEHVTFLEFNSHAAQQIKDNVATLQVDNASVVCTDARQFLSNQGQAFDLVFIDPPFRQNLLNEIIDLLEANAWLAPKAVIYVEAEKEFGQPVTPSSWQLRKEQVAGQVCFRLYEREVV